MTKYRLIPINQWGHTKMYLQFLYTYKKKTWFGWGKEEEKSVWLYVPRNSITYGPLEQHECDSGFDSGYRYKSSFFGQEHYFHGVISFTKKYPDIEVYFEHRRKQYQRYLEDQEKQKSAKVVEL